MSFSGPGAIFIDVAYPGFPGGFPGVIEGFGGELFLAGEVAVDPAFLQPGCGHQLGQRTAFIAVLVEDRSGGGYDLASSLFALRHTAAGAFRAI